MSDLTPHVLTDVWDERVRQDAKRGEQNHRDGTGLLDAFHAAGLIEDGFYRMSLERGATFVRKPGVVKQATDSNSVGGRA